MEKKNQANQYFKEGEYEQAIKLYSEILETDETDYAILSNRTATYIKANKYDLALNDAIKTTKLRPECSKVWGRLGAALYGQHKFEEALIAYNKANELEPLEIYTQMVEQIKGVLQTMKPKLMDILQIYDSVKSDPKIMEKLADPEFQNRVLSLQNNPMEAMNDKEVMDIINNMMKGMFL